jgi:hypothetical protein
MDKKIDLIKIFLLCPIPDEQKPINLYINLKKYLYFNLQNHFFFDEKIKNVLTLFNFQSFSKLNFFLQLKNFYQLLYNSSFLFWIRLNDLKSNFKKSNLIYEETSWYDPQFWEKSFFIIKNDRLITLLIIQPILKRDFFFF